MSDISRETINKLLSLLFMTAFIFISEISFVSAATPEEYDKKRSELASKYEVLNTENDSLILQWNHLLLAEASVSAVKKAESDLISCFANFSNIEYLKERCEQSKANYIKILKQIKLKLGSGIPSNHHLFSKFQVEEINKVIDVRIKKMESNEISNLMTEFSGSLCKKNLPSIKNLTYRRYDHFMSVGQLYDGLKLAAATRSLLNSLTLLGEICSANSTDYHAERNFKEGEISRQLILISFLEAKINARFIGAKTCLKRQHDIWKIRRVRNNEQFLYVCTMLIDQRILETLEEGETWLNQTRKILNQVDCQTAVISSYQNRKKFLGDRQFIGENLKVNDCNFSDSPWESLTVEDANEVRKLMFSVLNIYSGS